MEQYERGGSLNIEELALEAKAGNKAALELLLRGTYQDVFRLIHWKTRDYHLAWDLAQETFAKLLKYISTFDPSLGAFKTWLYKIALNIVNDYYRSRSFKQSQMDKPLEELQGSGDILDGVLLREEMREFMQAVNTLPQSQRDVILLKFMHGLKFKEISKVLESNEATVKSRARLGLMKLRDLLKRGENNAVGTGNK